MGVSSAFASLLSACPCQDVDTRDNEGHTPLMWAAMKIHE